MALSNMHCIKHKQDASNAMGAGTCTLGAGHMDSRRMLSRLTLRGVGGLVTWAW